MENLARLGSDIVHHSPVIIDHVFCRHRYWCLQNKHPIRSCTILITTKTVQGNDKHNTRTQTQAQHQHKTQTSQTPWQNMNNSNKRKERIQQNKDKQN
eukprot:54681-Lingulodinium_polyedra.AAC.1